MIDVGGNLFLEISLLLAISVIICGVMRFFKQPLIIGYIIVGIIVSPYVLNLVPSTGAITTFAQFGEVLLLFMVGLNLNPKIIKDLGKVSLITGVGQVLFTSLIGLVISWLLGFDWVTSIFVVLALTFSSTIIITKLLSDKGDMETLYGRISIGFLIVQDLIAILILMTVSSLSVGTSLGGLLVGSILKGIGLLLLLFLLGVFVLPKLSKVIAKSQEYLLLFSLGWCLALAALFNYLQFSLEIGALLAGITLSISPFRYEISSKLKPLRDFFIILFFILIGTQMTFVHVGNYIVPIIIFSLFILIGNPLIVMILMGLLGYTKRTSFFAGLTVAQISEFSFILIALGVKTGYLSQDILSLITAIGIITIAGSTYFILYADKMYNILSPYLTIFERKGAKIDKQKNYWENNFEVILFGYNRIGYSLLRSFKKMRMKFLVVDYNPEVVVQLNREGVPCQYGDASDLELLTELNLSKVKMIVSTIPDLDTNLLILNQIKQRNEKAIVIMVSHQIDEALKLYDSGASYVLMPHFVGGHHTSLLIEDYGFNLQKFLKEKTEQRKHLQKRKSLGHEHPLH